MGDTVLIERAGDVIPYVVQVVAAKRPPDSRGRYAFPERCPACGGVAFRPEGEAYWRCMNAPARPSSRSGCATSAPGARWTSSTSARRSVEQLVDRGLVKDFADLYRLDRRRSWPSWSASPTKSAQNLVSAIDGSQDARARPPSERARHPHGGRARRAAAGRRASASLERLAAASEADLAEIARHRPADRGVGRESSSTTDESRVIARPREPGRRSHGARRARSKAPSRSPARRSSSPAPCPRSPATPRASWSSARRTRHLARSRARRTTSWSARRRAARRTTRSGSACPFSTKPLSST